MYSKWSLDALLQSRSLDVRLFILQDLSHSFLYSRQQKCSRKHYKIWSEHQQSFIQLKYHCPAFVWYQRLYLWEKYRKLVLARSWIICTFFLLLSPDSFGGLSLLCALWDQIIRKQRQREISFELENLDIPFSDVRIIHDQLNHFHLGWFYRWGRWIDNWKCILVWCLYFTRAVWLCLVMLSVRDLLAAWYEVETKLTP